MPRRPQDIPEATLKLLLVPGVGPATMRKLAQHFGSHEAAAAATVTQLQEISGIGRQTAESFRRSLDEADLSSELELMTRLNASLIIHGDGDYPPLLATIADPPAALWVRGTLDERDRLCVAIVGSRKCSPYGREQSGRFAALLAQSGLTIASGGAVGIDGEAHRGALRVNGRTIAVLGCGLNHTYPPVHRDLFEQIAGNPAAGALVSEYPMNSPPRATNFPSRNRIISGLSLGVLVIEAARRSGALITARLAAEEHHREVMAIPGRVDSPSSIGCLEAIRDGWASVVLNHADVLGQLDGCSQQLRGAVALAQGVTEAPASLFDAQLTESQRAIISVLEQSSESLVVDQIVARTQHPLSQTLSDLTLLQIRGRVHKDHAGVRLRKKTSP